MYGYARLLKRLTCLFNRFRSYDKIAAKSGAGGLKKWEGGGPKFMGRYLIGENIFFFLNGP